jgi:DNA-binding response OmpR family regulator
VLVIDDDEDISAATALILKEDGHEVDVELDAGKAMERAAAFQPDLVVLDVMFPGDATAGFDLARRLKSLDQSLRIVMVTSVNDHGKPKFSNDDRDPDWLPVDEFVEKPVKKGRLLELVRSLLGNSRRSS